MVALRVAARSVSARVLIGLLALGSGCAHCPQTARADLDTTLPFDLTAGEPLVARYYAYPFGGPGPSWGYRLGWDELDGCLASAEPALPGASRAYKILDLAQTLATAVARNGGDTTLHDLVQAGAVPEGLDAAGAVRASYYLGALLRCAEQGRLIMRTRE